LAQFIITAMRPGNQKVRMLYDNATSALTWETGQPVAIVEPTSWGSATIVSPESPGHKADIKVLKIALGLSCNYSCTYCSQRFVPHAADIAHKEVEPFLAKLPTWFDPSGTDGQGAGLKVEFWGGEPFVYWKTMKPLAERLRAMMPNATFVVITNGSLLDTEKNEWLDQLGFNVGLSHDGPGQGTRGPDPLDDPEKAAAIRDLYARLHPKKRMSFNTMMHRDNQSRAAVQQWFVSRFGQDVRIGEGSFIDPYDAGGLSSSLRDHDHLAYRRQAFNELRNGAVANFHISHAKLRDFVGSIQKGRPATALGQKCGMDRSDNIAVTLRGEVVTCQNVSPVAKAPNGQAHKIGTVAKLDEVKLTTATHWSKRPECADCPVLQLCKGSCMFLEGELWERGCDNSFSDNVPFFAAAIEYLTGAMPVHIEGPQRSDRKWLFGAPQVPKTEEMPPISGVATARLAI
jgi:uncharacterized protein